MNKILEILPLPLLLEGDFPLRRCVLRRFDKDSLVNERTLWFRIDPPCDFPPEDDCDSYLIASLMEAMLEGRDIHVKGAVSRQLLENLAEYQVVWRKWLPGSYSVVDILPERIRDVGEVRDGAISTFSGGVDSTFTVWRHVRRQCGPRSHTIRAGCLVHGFDIPLSDGKGFAGARQKAVETLADVGVDLTVVHTNFREVIKINWEHVFGCALVAALGNLKYDAGTCLVPSGEPYDALVLPWGSTPLTDHLLSSSEFRVVHDGAGYNRTEKVAAIAGWAMGVENLRVCWQGGMNDRNCGRCEKCLRTKINFRATGNPVPGCLPGSPGEDAVLLDSMVLHNDVARIEWRQILAYVGQKGVTSPWVNRIGDLLERKPEKKKPGAVTAGSRLRQIFSGSW